MTETERTIIATSLYGNPVEIPVSRLSHRVSAYGIILHEGHILLQNTRYTGKYAFPGGGIDVGETIPEAIVREVQEEAGIDVEVGEFLHFADNFFYYDPLDVAFHGFLFFHHCKPLTFDLHSAEDVQDDDVTAPEWVNLSALTVDDFQYHIKIMQPLLAILQKID